jgi:hypothetical protein
MRKLSVHLAAGLCFGTLLGTLTSVFSSALLVSPVQAGTFPVIQNSSGFVPNPGFKGQLSDPQVIENIRKIAQSKLAQLRAGGATSQLLARVLVNPTLTDKTQLGQLFQALGISPESSAALIDVLAGLLSETPATTTSSLQTLPVSSSDHGSGVLSQQNSSIALSALGINPRLAEADVTIEKKNPIAVNTDKLIKAIAIYNQIIDESSPQTLAMFAQNSDFKILGDTLRNLRSAIG